MSAQTSPQNSSLPVFPQDLWALSSLGDTDVRVWLVILLVLLSIPSSKLAPSMKADFEKGEAERRAEKGAFSALYNCVLLM